MKFVDHSDKTEAEVAKMITETHDSQAIPLDDCRAQGHDNAASM